MSRNRKCLCVLCVLMLLCSAAFAQQAPQLLEPAGVRVDTAQACVKDLSKIQVFEASVVPHTQELWFEREGEIEQINVIPGQMVRAGDVLITLAQEDEEKRIEELAREIEQTRTNGAFEDEIALIDLDILQLQLRMLREQSPRDDAAIALKELEMEEKQLDMELAASLRSLKLERLQAEMDTLQKTLDQNVITAPFDGRVVHMNFIEHGQYVGAYSPLVYLADDTQLFVECSFINGATIKGAHELYAMIGSQRYALEHVEMDEKEYISKMLSGEKVMTRFALPASASSVASGEYAAVCLVSQHASEALTIPTNALFSDTSGRYVYVMENGSRVRRDVKVGMTTDWETQILEGIEEGEIVYVKE